MAIEAWVTRSPMGHIVPANAQSAEALSAIPAQEWRKVKVWLPRNVKHHRKYFALLNAIFPHQTMWPTFNKFREKFEEALGLGEYHVNGRGERYFEKDSISFDKMGQDEFEQFYNRAIALIMTRILPGVESQDLEREISDIMEGRKAA